MSESVVKNKPPDSQCRTQSLLLQNCVQKSFPTYTARICKEGMRTPEDKMARKCLPGPGPSSSQKERCKVIANCPHDEDGSADHGAFPSERTQSKATHAYAAAPPASLPRPVPTGRPDPQASCMLAGMLDSTASLEILLTCGKHKENLHTLILYMTASTQRF